MGAVTCSLCYVWDFCQEALDKMAKALSYSSWKGWNLTKNFCQQCFPLTFTMPMRKPRLLNKSSRLNPKCCPLFLCVSFPVHLSSREFLPPLTNTKPNEMVESLRMTGLLLVILHLLLTSRCWFTGCWSVRGCHPAYWGTWGTFALSRLIFRLKTEM